jgi:hypothetical protein
LTLRCLWIFKRHITGEISELDLTKILQIIKHICGVICIRRLDVRKEQMRKMETVERKFDRAIVAYRMPERKVINKLELEGDLQLEIRVKL